MALEFALRPRISLERPAPRRRFRLPRLPRLAGPIVAYWLAIAGVTHVLLRMTAEESPDGTTRLMPSRRSDEIDEVPPSAAPPELPSSPVLAQNAVTSPEPRQDFERAPVPPPAVESPKAPEPAFARGTTEPFPVAQRDAVAPAKQASVFVARPTEPPPVVARAKTPLVPRTERRQSERPAPPPPFELPPPDPSEVAEAPARQPPRDDAPSISLPSCEAAAASANETIDVGAAPGAPDLTRDAFASVLENGAYLARCTIPERTALDICAAVRDGKVVGVSVASQPRSPSINACVRRAVASLRFPRSARLDVTRTRFGAAR